MSIVYCLALIVTVSCRANYCCDWNSAAIWGINCSALLTIAAFYNDTVIAVIVNTWTWLSYVTWT